VRVRMKWQLHCLSAVFGGVHETVLGVMSCAAFDKPQSPVTTNFNRLLLFIYERDITCPVWLDCPMPRAHTKV